MGRKSNNTKRNTLIVAMAIVILGGGLAALERFGVTNFVSDKSSPYNSEAKTTSTAPTAQEDFNGGDPRDASSGNRNEGTIQDTGGNASTTPQNQWSVSADQRVTVYTPAKNMLLKKDDPITGASSLGRVSFRLIDDVSGVIAEGSLSVVNGKYSGSFDFSTTGTSGRLDVFSVNAEGVESSNVEVPVRFK